MALYGMIVQVPIVVWATDEQEAKALIGSHVIDEAENYLQLGRLILIKRRSDLPSPEWWGSIPWNEPHDRTVREILERTEKG